MRNVVIIDDNPKIADFIRDVIDWDTLDCSLPVVFYAPVSALDYLQEHHFDIIISDIKMPEISGIEMSKRILGLNSAALIILISGYADIHDVQEAIRFGAFDYIEKPVDIQYLNKILEKAVRKSKENEIVLQQLEERKSMLLDSFLEQILERPGWDEEKIKEYCDYYGLDNTCASYICLILKHHNVVLGEYRSDVENYHKGMILLENRLLEIFMPQKFVRRISKFSSTILVIGMEQQEGFPDCDQLRAVLDTVQNLQLSIGIGKTVSKLSDLYYSLETAESALEFRFMYHSENVFEYTNLMLIHDKETIYVDDQSEALINLIHQNHPEEISVYLRSFYFNKCTREKAEKISIILSIVETGRKVIDFARKVGCFDELSIDRLPEINKDATLENFISWIEKIALQTCTLFNKEYQSYYKMLADRVDAYILKNYENSELRINDIAELIGISPNYLSSLYKKITGINISDAITNKRISMACERLIYSEAPIKEICVESGFSNQYYFSAAFKRNIGMSPSEYRAKYKK